MDLVRFVQTADVSLKRNFGLISTEKDVRHTHTQKCICVCVNESKR